MYLTHNDRKSVIVESFIRILHRKIYRYMCSILEMVYNDQLEDIVVNEYIS